MQPRFGEGHLAANLRLVEAVKALASDRGITPGQLALAWVQSRGDDVVPIPGTKRLRYLEENVAAAAVVLSEGDLAPHSTRPSPSTRSAATATPT